MDFDFGLMKQVCVHTSQCLNLFVSFLAPPTKRVKLIGQPVSKKWSMGVPGY